MEIKFTFDDKRYAAEIKYLEGNLPEGYSLRAEKLNKIAEASFMEYLKMLAGAPMPSKIDDIKQLRLLNLSIYLYGNKLPSVQEVASMFQITDSAANTLLNNMIAKFPNEIKTILNKTVSEILAKEKDNEIEGKYYLDCTSPVILSHMNRKLSMEYPKAIKVSRRSGTAGELVCSKDTYNYLCTIFNSEVT